LSVAGQFCQQFTASPPGAQHIDNYGGVEEEAHQRLRVRFPRLGRASGRASFSDAQLSNPHACGQLGMDAVSPGRFSPGQRLAFQKLQQLLTPYLGSSGLD
jgi:hypothetical protein